MSVGSGFEASPRPGMAATDLTDFKPAHSFDQGFTVPFPPERVFALFGRPEEVASCLPGATITAQLAPDRVDGAITVKLGPISAAFRGSALIERDEATRSGRILGAGQDGGGRSSTRGLIGYRVLPGLTDDSSRVELSVGYTLKGALAQFGRPGLVRDLAGRITADFARNLEAHLAGKAPPTPARSLDTLSLMSGLLRGWIDPLLSRIRTRLRQDG